jgi:hypothetical protein
MRGKSGHFDYFSFSGCGGQYETLKIFPLTGTKKRSGRECFKNLLIEMLQWRFSLPVGAWEAALRADARWWNNCEKPQIDDDSIDIGMILFCLRLM